MNHADLAADLPFYANGTLDAARCAEIEAELAVCERCALELHSIEVLRDALLDAERGATAGHDTDAVLSDVLARIDAETSGPKTPDSDLAKPTTARVRPLRRISPRTFQIGGGIAAVFAIGIGLANVGHHSDSAPAPESAVVAPPPAADVAAGAAPAAAGAAPAAQEEFANASRVAPRSLAAPVRRQLARDGSVVLIVSDVDGVIARIQHLAAAESGVVTHLDDNAPSVSGARHTATLTLSVPETRFDATMTDLTSYGMAKSRSVKTEDLTGAIVDTDARLRNLRREESDLLKIMDRSGKIEDVLDVENKLASTRQEIEQLDGEAKSMRLRVSDSTISVSLSDEKTATPVHPGVGVQLSNSWNHSMADVRNFTVRQISRLFEILAFSPYLAVVAVLATFAFKRLRRAQQAAAASVPRGPEQPA